MILEGAAYYDVEGKDGKWIRVLWSVLGGLGGENSPFPSG